MSNLELLSGLVGHAASEPLGVPDGYGFICAACWIVLTAIAVFILPANGEMEAVSGLPARGAESADKSIDVAPAA
jgi:hypothetical protein